MTDALTPYRSYPLRFPVIGFIAATVLWFIMFAPVTAPLVNFWMLMTLSAASLTIYSLIVRRAELAAAFRVSIRDVAIGLATAALLYGVFFVGDAVSRLLFSFAQQQVGGVYATRTQADTRLIGALLLFIIGPAEEIFWRGFAQEQLMQRFGAAPGFLVTTAVYTLVHVPSLNFMLIMAALIAGLFWGWMYLKLRRLAPCIISHAVWDCVIFAIAPIIHA